MLRDRSGNRVLLGSEVRSQPLSFAQVGMVNFRVRLWQANVDKKANAARQAPFDIHLLYV